MRYELYRLDQPDEVVYEVNAENPKTALAVASCKAWRANELFMYSQNTFTALCKKGVLGVRRKGQAANELPPVKGMVDDFDGMAPGKRGRKKGVA